MTQETDTKIGVFFGSRSPEHDVSIITGELTIRGLKEVGYTVVPVYLSSEGRWYIGEELASVEFFKTGNLSEKLSKLSAYSLDLKASIGQMVFRSAGLLSKKEVVINLAFPAFHGANGEDGTIQGLFELCNIAYVGCGVTSSAIAMDKVLTKLLYQRYKIPTTDFVSFSRTEWQKYKEAVLEEINELGLPLFVKPARTGSSIGIAKVTTLEELEFAIEVALHYDVKVLVEKAVENLADLTVCVIGNQDPLTSLIQESRFSSEFFSYEDKYLNDGGAQLGNATKNLVIPAEIGADIAKKIQNMARDIYIMFECSGIARVDFLYDRLSGKVYANEINTLPGTLYHHLWRESGLELRQLLKDLVRYAKEMHREKNRVTQTFKSDILSTADSQKLSRKLHS